MVEFQKHSISIRFLLYGYGREDRKTYPVYAAIILNRKCTQLTMKMFAKEDDWDFENGKYLQHKEFCVYANNKLSEEKNKILTAYFDVKKDISKPDLKAVVNLYRGAKAQSPATELMNYYDAYVEEMKQLPDQYSFGAINHYRKTRTHLILFLTKKGWLNIKLSELDSNFIMDFEHHLLTTPNLQNGYKPMNENTSGTYLKKIKCVVNNAIKRRILLSNPFLGFQMKKSKKTNRTYLNIEEIEAIRNCDFRNDERLDKARDFFLFSVYSGLRHSDAYNLKEENIRIDKAGVKWINLVQIKTSDPLEVPMLKETVFIYNKYEQYRRESGYVLPRFINQSINRDLKIIAKLAGITKRISHHVARHTFATTILLERGTELKTTSKFLGHTSVKSTEVYGKISNVRLVDATNQLDQNR